MSTVIQVEVSSRSLELTSLDLKKIPGIQICTYEKSEYGWNLKLWNWMRSFKKGIGKLWLTDQIWPHLFSYVSQIFISKVHLSTAIPIGFHSAQCWFFIMTAKLSSCNRDMWPAKSKIFYCLALYRKRLPAWILEMNVNRECQWIKFWTLFNTEIKQNTKKH